MTAVDLGGNLHSFHVTSTGLLVWNVWGPTGGRPTIDLGDGTSTIVNRVVQSGRYASSPVATLLTEESGGWLIQVFTVLSNGDGDRVNYYSNDGWWRNASGATITV